MQYPEPLYRGKSKVTGEWMYGDLRHGTPLKSPRLCIIEPPYGLGGEVHNETVGMFTGFTAVWEEFEEAPIVGLTDPTPKMSCFGYDRAKCSCNHKGVHDQNATCGNKCSPTLSAACYPVDEKTGRRKMTRTEVKIFTGMYLKQSLTIHTGQVGWNEKCGHFAVAWEDRDKRVYWVPLHAFVNEAGTQEIRSCKVSETPFKGE